MALGLVQIAVHGVGELLRRVMLEMHGLPGVGADAGRHEHQPGEQPARKAGVASGRNLPVFSAR